MDKDFVALHGNVLYIGFSVQFALNRLHSGKYFDETLQKMLESGYFCCCVCAMDLDKIDLSDGIYKSSMLDVERLVYGWFADKGFTLLNRTLHNEKCPCDFCVSGLFCYLVC